MADHFFDKVWGEGNVDQHLIRSGVLLLQGRTLAVQHRTITHTVGFVKLASSIILFVSTTGAATNYQRPPTDQRHITIKWYVGKSTSYSVCYGFSNYYFRKRLSSGEDLAEFRDFKDQGKLVADGLIE